MYSYVARQSILDINKEIFAYELLFRDGINNSFPDVCPNEATSKILTQNHLASGLSELTNGKLAFINFHEEALLHNFPTSLPVAEIFIEILEDVPISPALVLTCKKLKQLKYKIALDDHDFDPKWDVLLPYVDMLKIDVRQTNILQINKYLRRLAEKNIRIDLLAEKVETAQEFEQLKHLGFKYFQGYFFARPEVMRQKSLAPNQQILMELIGESSKVDLDTDKISQLIERDVSLSYKLLRFINSAAFARGQTIGSLKHALVYMGANELKKFTSLIAIANIGNGKPDELVNLSIIRGRFCAQLASFRQDCENPPMAFLTGLFSLIDALLDLELSVAVEKLPVTTEIKQALIAGVGDLALYLKLAINFEKGHWDHVEALAEQLNVPLPAIDGFYQDAIKWANSFNQPSQS